MHIFRLKLILFTLFFSLVNFVVDKNYGDVAGNDHFRKNFKAFVLEFYESRKPDSIKEQELEENLQKLKITLNTLKENSILFVTHGVISKTSPSNYFFNEKGIRDNESYMKTLAYITKSKEYYFLRWEGRIDYEDRIVSAKRFASEIEDKVKEFANINQLDKKKVPINLAGHSFGATVFILTANILKEKGYNVQLLITFNCSNNEYKLLYSDIHQINFFSYNDWIVQLFGSIYIYKNFRKMTNFGPGRVTFDNAINISIDPFVKKGNLIFLNNNKTEDKKIKANIYHHAIRSELFLKNIIDKLNTIEKDFQKSYSFPNESDSWNGEYNIKLNKDKTTQIKIKRYNNKTVISFDENKELIIYDENKNNFSRKTGIKAIPFYSSGYLKEKFIIENNSFFYYLDLNISILFAKSRAKLLLKIKKESNNNYSGELLEKNSDILFKK